MFYLIWVTWSIILYSFCAIFTKMAQDNPSSWTWVWALYGINVFGVWPIVAKYSKDVVFDSFLYDFTAFSSYFIVLFILGAGSRFTVYQWVGVGLIIIGFVILKSGSH